MPNSDAIKQNEEQYPTDLQNKSKRSKRTIILIVCGLVTILLALGVLVALYLQNKNSETGSSAKVVCSGELLDEAVITLAPIDYSKAKQLEEINNKIIALNDYEKDPNCLYPVMQRYVFASDFANAIEIFNKFESVYGDGSSFAGDRFAIDIEALRAKVVIYKERLENNSLKSNGAGFGPPVNSNQGQGN